MSRKVVYLTTIQCLSTLILNELQTVDSFRNQPDCLQLIPQICFFSAAEYEANKHPLVKVSKMYLQ